MTHACVADACTKYGPQLLRHAYVHDRHSKHGCRQVLGNEYDAAAYQAPRRLYAVPVREFRCGRPLKEHMEAA